jgi:DNA polymerase I-like protein with 3'-5' exonuclease and polymerase domains
MNLITLDFETFYDVGFSLSNLTTEEYIRDERFQIIGVGIKINDGSTKWYSGEEADDVLKSIDWSQSVLLCHNTMFDGAILSMIYNIHPAIYLDTLSMARAVNGVDVGGSLAFLAKYYNLGEKGHEVIDAKGKRLEDFQEHELHRYGMYCKNDVELTYNLFNILSKDFPQKELELIDMTLRMYTQPLLEVDDGLLQARLEEVKTEKQELLSGLMNRLGCETEEEVRKKLASNKQFAELLQELGVTVPLKISPTTNKETYALAKGDTGFLELCDHEDNFIQELCRVRLGTKSTIEESRIERFLDIGARNKGKLPIPLKYYGAHTGRWAGSDKVNFQNLPSRDVKKKALKNGVIAPLGYKVINCDSSQIEARVLVWLAGQNDVMQWFKEGRDVYSEFASKVYNKPVDEITKQERAVGKTCILGLGYGTGAKKLQLTLKLMAGVEIDEEESKRLVKVYRDVNEKVIELWRECENALHDIASWPHLKKPYYLGQHQCLLVTQEGIELPNGLYIRYPKIRLDTTETRPRFLYKSRRGEVGIWGGSVVENVVQALARIIVGEQMLEINKKYRPVLTVHDAAVCVVPEDEVESAQEYVMKVMSTPPDWAKGLPVACEASYGDSYGEC